MFWSQISESPVERKLIWQWRQHQVKQADGHKVIHAIGDEPTAFRGTKVEKPSHNCRETAGNSDKKAAAGNNQTSPCHEEHGLFMQPNLCA